MISIRRKLMAKMQPCGGRLPSAYQEVGYIGSTVVGSPNRSWIDTLIYPTNETDIRLVYSGYYQNPNPWQGAKCFVDARDGNKRYELNDATFNFGTSWNSQWNHNVTPPESGTLEIIGGKLYLDGVLKLDKSDQIFTLNSTLTLFTSRNDDTRQNKFNLISFKVWQASDLIGDFVPCYRKSDHKPGLYDLVSSQFFVNQGDVEFIVGQNIN